MEKRPYFRSGISDLEELLENATTPEDLNILRDELQHRKTSRARKLFARVEEALSSSASGKNVSPSSNPRAQSTTVKTTPSEPRHAQQKVRTEPAEATVTIPTPPKSEPGPVTRNNSVPDSTPLNVDDLIPKFLHALAIEVDAIRAVSHETSIDLYNGKKVEGSVDSHVYQFAPNKEVYLRDDAPVMVVIGERETNGTVVSISDKGILIAIDDDYGPFLSHAQIRVDNSYLVERLRTRFDEIQQGDTEYPFNAEMMFKVSGIKESVTGVLDSDPEMEKNLNTEQINALRISASTDVSFVWGPPGTGKTYTLARIVDAFYRQGKRVLVISNTNIAVDTLLEKVCERMKATDDPAFKKGSIVRYGAIVKEELRQEYEEYVDILAIVERLSEELTRERKALLSQQHELEEKSAPLEEVMQVFEKLGVVLPEAKRLKAELEKIDAKKIEMEVAISRIEPEMSRLQQVLTEAKNMGIMMRILKGKNPATIQRHINALPVKRVQFETQLDTLNKAHITGTHRYAEITSWVSSQRTILDTYNRDDVCNKLAVIRKKMEPIGTRLVEIDVALGQIRDEVLGNCKVLAATATQTYLRPRDFKMFDVVIVDEASMLVLPLAAYVAGLATEKVIIAGDFRQLPPIVQTKDENAFFWLGRTIFHQAGVVESVNTGQKPANLVKLNEQYRMEKVICDLINERYYGGTLVTSIDRGERKPADSYPAFLAGNLIVVNTASQVPFANTKPNSYSRYNILHVLGIRALVQWMSENGHINSRDDVGVITPYTHQSRILSRVLKDIGLNEVSVGTVHRFQGNEKDIIIFDISDSYGLWKPSLLIRAEQIEDTGANLINVAVSRAKTRLVVFANLEYLDEKLSEHSYMQQILKDMQQQGKVIDINDIFDLCPDGNKFFDTNSNIPELEVDPTTSHLFNEKTFDAGLSKDIEAATHSVVIFSGFTTPAGVAKIADLIRFKIGQGVQFRIVTRPPYNQGSIDAELVREAIYPLQKLGAVVDLRHGLHEKCCFIDGQIVWSGSLNPLSHTGATSEMMMRMCGKESVEIIAESLIAVHKTNRDTDSNELLVQQENPSCPSCNALTVFHPRGRYGPYFDCEKKCGWSLSLDKYRRKGAVKSGTSNSDSSKAETNESRICPDCGKEMMIRSGRYGRFWGCKGYPKCRHTEKI